MKNWPIGKRIIAGFSVVIVVIFALVSLVRIELNLLAEHTDALAEDALPGVIFAAEGRYLVSDNIALLYQYIHAEAQEKPMLEKHMSENSAHITEALSHYEKKLQGGKDRELFDRLIAARSAYLTEFQAILTLSRNTMVERSVSNVYQRARRELGPLADQYAKAYDALDEHENAGATEAAKLMEASMVHSHRVLMAGAIGALVAAVFISIAIIRSVTIQLSENAQILAEGSAQTAAAAHEISKASQTLAAGASEQAAALEETSASLEEVGSMTKRNAQNARTAQELSKVARQTTEIGVSGMRAMAASTEGIRRAADDMSSTMHGIKGASADVSKIIKTIDEIAFQTNILALNAAVEAARAGEAGMGFAVVADEVRNLAQRSAQAARETAEMIETSIKRSEEGTKVSERVVSAVEEVAAKVKEVEDHLVAILKKSAEVDEQVAQIATASSEQAQGISQVATAVTQMDQVTQSNAASAEESASAAEEMNAQAVTLRAAVAQLEKLAGRKLTREVMDPAVSSLEKTYPGLALPRREVSGTE